MKSLIATLILLIVATSAHAVKLRPGHPNEVIVTRGDTLWDISGRFLQHPWEWPKLWKANPRIKNPHLIYPGDRLYLKWINGQPRLVHSRGRQRGSAIPTVDYRYLKKFLSRPFLVDKEILDNSGHLVAFGDEYMMATKGSTAYARKLDPSVSNYTIIRPWKTYEDTETGKPIGKGSLYVGTAKVKRHGDPATLVITDSAIEVQKGDLLIPSTHDKENLHHHPSVPSNSVRGHIIDVVGGLFVSGQYQTIAIDRGSRDGLKPGNVLLIETEARVDIDKIPASNSGDSYRDTDREIWFKGYKNEAFMVPEESAGKVIIYRVYDNISFGIIVDSYRQIRIGYPVRNP